MFPQHSQGDVILYGEIKLLANLFLNIWGKKKSIILIILHSFSASSAYIGDINTVYYSPLKPVPTS